MPKHFRRITVTAVAAGMLLLSASWIAAADSARQTSGFPVLRTVMQDLGRNMQIIADSVLREDWATVAKTAPLLTDRPQPSMGEKVRILGFLGTSAGAFRGYDKETRDAAQALELAARRGDRKAAIAAFSTLERSCLGCHRDFRERLLKRSQARP